MNNISGGQSDGGLLQGGVSSPHLLPQQRGRAARPALLLQGLPRPRPRAQPRAPAGARHHARRQRAEGHGAGAQRPRHPRQRRLRLEGELPRERRRVAPARDALGRDEVRHLLLQGEQLGDTSDSRTEVTIVDI